MRLSRNFFSKGAQIAAKNLLGKVIVRREGKRVWGGKIVEVEAYLGKIDKAAHSFGGRRTKRTEIMFAGGGFAYMFFVYGVHWQLNVTCGRAGEGQAVLIRALEPIGQGRSLTETPQGPALQRIASGPGKVSKFLEVDGNFYGEDLSISERIWIEDREEAVARNEITRAKRVGIEYAQEWKDLPLRFYLTESKAVSKRNPRGSGGF